MSFLVLLLKESVLSNVPFVCRVLWGCPNMSRYMGYFYGARKMVFDRERSKTKKWFSVVFFFKLHFDNPKSIMQKNTYTIAYLGYADRKNVFYGIINSCRIIC